MADHKGHRVGDVGENKSVKVFQKRAQIFKKKIDVSRGETEIFSDELSEIEEQLNVSQPLIIFRTLKNPHFLNSKKNLKC